MTDHKELRERAERPTGSGMPKPDFIGQEKGEPSEYEAYYIINGESDVQRCVQQLRKRAEKAEAENTRLREALDTIDTFRLRVLAEWFDKTYSCNANTEVQDDLRKWADTIDDAHNPKDASDE